jgi:hypothetical protein
MWCAVSNGPEELTTCPFLLLLLLVACCCSCTDLQGLTEQQTRECVKAASFKLEFPGTLGPTAAAAGALAAATGAITEAAGAAGREMKLDGAAATAAVTNDLASLHAAALQAGQVSGVGKVESYLGRRMSGPDGGLGFIEQMLIIVCVAGAAWFGYSRLQKYRLSRAKGHSRSE